MNHCSLQQNAFGDMRGLVSVFDQKEPVVCPKPRRVGILAGAGRPWRLQISQTAEVGDSEAGAELLDIIFSKDYGSGQYAVASSPPYFCGSPPSRAVNPIVHDAHFGDEKPSPLSPLAIPSPSGLSSPSSASRKGSCIRTKFGLKPAAVRIEGFDCLNRDRQNSSIPAMA